MNEILSIHDLSVNYGGIEAVKGISFDVHEGEIVTLIGANGAGKSSTLRTIAGLVKPSGGTINFRGDNITGRDATTIVKKGITLVPEGRHIFPDLTVLENLKVGAYLRSDDISGDIQWVYDLFPRLRERSWQAGGTLSGGEQQMLAVGRALMARPKLIMMDEPSLGLAPLVVRDIFEIIRQINHQGVSILLIEQNANMALKVADSAYVMETGCITLSGAGKAAVITAGIPGGAGEDSAEADSGATTSCRIPSSRSAVRHAKKTARPTCFTALPPFCRKTKFVPCMNDSFRMGTHTFIIPLLSRFVNVTSGLFRAESEKIHFRGRKTHNLNIFSVFVRLHLRGRCDRIRENRGKCFPANFRKE